MIRGNACSASCARVCVAGGGGGFAFGSLLKYHLRRNCEVTWCYLWHVSLEGYLMRRLPT